MGLWESHVLPRVTEAALSNAPVAELRSSALRSAVGRVLELGFGSGTNLPHYPASVTQVGAIEPSDTAWRMSRKRRREAAYAVERVGLDGTRLNVPSDHYDTVTVAFALCTIPDPEEALREVCRVLVPGGRLCALEHGLAPDAEVARRQRRLDPWERRVFGGCHLTRDPIALVRQAGLDVTRVEQDYLPGLRIMRPWNYLTVLEAVHPGSR